MVHYVQTRLLTKLSRNRFDLKRYLSSQEFIDRDKKYGGLHCKTLPVAIAKGEGSFAWDVEGKRYFDFLGGFATLSQGHCHPRLVKVMQEQVATLTHTSRAFHSKYHGLLCEYLTQLMGYDRFLPMNTGNEAGETALKIARSWGYKIKKIPMYEATTVFVENNFWGRSLAAVSSSSFPELRDDFGPYMPNFEIIKYDDLNALENILKTNPNICAFMIEPIQGEAGVIIPKEGYLKGVRDLCTKYNVLWIADEVQTGLCRTGKRLACDHENVKPDMVVLGKALGGGMYPVSGVLAYDQHILNLKKGSHGSTFGGNPLGMRIAIEAVKILEEENLAENARKMETVIKNTLGKLPKEIASEVRCKGLMAAVELREGFGSGWEICLKLLKAGILTRAEHDRVLRILPPLVINEEQLQEGLEIMTKVLYEHQNENEVQNNIRQQNKI